MEIEAVPLEVPADCNLVAVANLFCATAHPVEVLVARTGQGRGVVGVVDGSPPRGVEDEAAREQRRAFLRKIGYKR